ALLNPPALLILDSPYIGLDATVRKELNKILGKLTETGTQIILIPGTFPLPDFITHVASIEKGRLSFFGQKESFSTAGSISEEDPKIIYDNTLLPASNEDYESGTI